MPIGQPSSKEQSVADLQVTLDDINNSSKTNYKVEDLIDDKKLKEITTLISREYGVNPANAEKTLKELTIGAGIAKSKPTTKLGNVKPPKVMQVQATPVKQPQMEVQPRQDENNDPSIIDYFVSGLGDALGSLATTVAGSNGNPMYGGYAPNDKATTKEDLKRAVGVGNAVSNYVGGNASKKIELSKNKYEGDAIKAFSEGKIGEGISQVGKMVAGSLPASLSLLNPATATSYAVGAVGRETDKLEKEGLAPEKALSSAVVKVSSDVILDKLFGGAKVLKGIIAKSGKEVAKDILEKSIRKEVGKAIVGGAGEEGLANFIQNASKILIEGKKDVGYFDNTGNSLLGGGAGVTMFTPLMTLQMKADKAIAEKNEKAQLQQKEQEFQDRSNLERSKLYNRANVNNTNKEGVSSEVGAGQKPVEQQPNQKTGGGAIETSRDVQGNEGTEQVNAEVLTNEGGNEGVNPDTPHQLIEGENISILTVNPQDPTLIDITDVNGNVETVNEQQLQERIAQTGGEIQPVTNLNNNNYAEGNKGNDEASGELFTRQTNGQAVKIEGGGQGGFEARPKSQDEARNAKTDQDNNDLQQEEEVSSSEPSETESSEGVEESTPKVKKKTSSDFKSEIEELDKEKDEFRSEDYYVGRIDKAKKYLAEAKKDKSKTPSQIQILESDLDDANYEYSRFKDNRYTKKNKRDLLELEANKLELEELEVELAELEANPISVNDGLKVKYETAKKRVDNASSEGTKKLMLPAYEKAKAEYDNAVNEANNHKKKISDLKKRKKQIIDEESQKKQESKVERDSIEKKGYKLRLKEVDGKIKKAFQVGFDSGVLKGKLALGKFKQKSLLRFQAIKNKQSAKTLIKKIRKLQKDKLIGSDIVKPLTELISNVNSKSVKQYVNLSSISNVVNAIEKGQIVDINIEQIKSINEAISGIKADIRAEQVKERAVKVKGLEAKKTEVKVILAKAILGDVDDKTNEEIDSELAENGYDDDEINKLTIKESERKSGNLQDDLEDSLIDNEKPQGRLEENEGLGANLRQAYETYRANGGSGLDVIDDMIDQEIESLSGNALKRAIYELNKANSNEGVEPKTLERINDELTSVNNILNEDDTNLQVTPIINNKSAINKNMGLIGKGVSKLRTVAGGIFGMGGNFSNIASHLSLFSNKGISALNNAFKLTSIQKVMNQLRDFNDDLEKELKFLRQGINITESAENSFTRNGITSFVNMMLQFDPTTDKGKYHQEQKVKVETLISNLKKHAQIIGSKDLINTAERMEKFYEEVVNVVNWNDVDAIEQFTKLAKEKGYEKEVDLADKRVEFYKNRLAKSKKYRNRVGSEARDIENYTPNNYNSTPNLETQNIKVSKSFGIETAKSSVERQKGVGKYDPQTQKGAMPLIDLYNSDFNWVKDEEVNFQLMPLLHQGVENMNNPLIVEKLKEANKNSGVNVDEILRDIKELYSYAYRTYYSDSVNNDSERWIKRWINPIIRNAVVANVYKAQVIANQIISGAGASAMAMALTGKLPNLIKKSKAFEEILKYTSIQSNVIEETDFRKTDTGVFKKKGSIATQYSKVKYGGVGNLLRGVSAGLKKITSAVGSSPDIMAKRIIFSSYLKSIVDSKSLLNKDGKKFKNDEQMYEYIAEGLRNNDPSVEYIVREANKVANVMGEAVNKMSKFQGKYAMPSMLVKSILTFLTPLQGLASSQRATLYDSFATLNSKTADLQSKELAIDKIAIYATTNILYNSFKYTLLYKLIGAYSISLFLRGGEEEEEDKDKTNTDKLIKEQLELSKSLAETRSEEDIAIGASVDLFFDLFPQIANMPLEQFGVKGTTKASLIGNLGSNQERVARNFIGKDAMVMRDYERGLASKTLVGQNSQLYDKEDLFEESVISKAIKLASIYDNWSQLNYNEKVAILAEVADLVSPQEASIRAITGNKDYTSKMIKEKIKLIEAIEKENTIGEKKFDYTIGDAFSEREMEKAIDKKADNLKSQRYMLLVSAYGKLSENEADRSIIIMPKNIDNPLTGKPFPETGIVVEGATGRILRDVLKKRGR